MQTKTENIIKRIVDMLLTVTLLFLMAFQVTGVELHEWIGIGMTALLILHNFLNRRWYKAVFKGKYSPYRIAVTVVNCLLLICFLMTALSGMAMSAHAVPFMYGLIDAMTARSLHLALSYWSFVLMGIHIGLHLRAMTAKLAGKGRIVFYSVLTAAAGAGLWLFIREKIISYMFFTTMFAFLDYDKPGWQIIVRNLLMLLFWALVGFTLGELTRKNKENRISPKALIPLACAAVIGTVLCLAAGGSSEKSFGSSGLHKAAAVSAEQSSDLPDDVSGRLDNNSTERK